MIGDVTDKGVPAALVMATTSGLVREIANQGGEPAEVLERVNRRLVDDIPPNMFVTCQFAAFEPSTGLLTLANAGHNVPYLRGARDVCDIHATGMPLGLMAGSRYDQCEVSVSVGSCVLFHSDGLAEARNVNGGLFGFPEVKALVAAHDQGDVLINALLAALTGFAADPVAIEDDVTLLTLERHSAPGTPKAAERSDVLEDFSIKSAPGNERDARLRVASAVEGLGMPGPTVERLKTAVAEAVMNAMEHGNHFDPDLAVDIRVMASDAAVSVEVFDDGGDVAVGRAVVPDIDAKLAGDQSPRGWGLFLIENMVDEMAVDTIGRRRRITLEVRR